MMFYLKLHLYGLTAWGLWTHRALILSVYVLLVSLVYGLFFSDDRIVLAQQQLELKKMSLVLSAQEADIQKIPMFEQQLSEAKTRTYLKIEKNMIFSKIRALAIDTKVNVMDIRLDEPTTALMHRIQPVNIVIRGDYQALLFFIDAISAQDSLLLMDLKMHLEQGFLQATCIIHIFLEPHHV